MGAACRRDVMPGRGIAATGGSHIRQQVQERTLGLDRDVDIAAHGPLLQQGFHAPDQAPQRAAMCCQPHLAGLAHRAASFGTSQQLGDCLA